MEYTHTLEITNQLLVTPKTKVGSVEKTNVITGVNKKYLTNLTEKDINRLQTIDPLKGPSSNF